MAPELDLPVNTLEVLKKRYLLKDKNRKTIEPADALFMRVAKCIARAEDAYPRGPGRRYIEEQFYLMMRKLEFMPNSPTLMNAGTSMGQLSACFVIPVEDSIDGIFEALRGMAKIHQTGGGTGFNFSSLRPKGDIVNSTKGEASGPVSFMRIFDEATGVVIQGGRRRGANMGILRCDHPDIVKFIQAKIDGVSFSNFNLSVAVTDKFMKAVKANGGFALINPRTKKAVKKVKAVWLFDQIIHAAWQTGDPGLVFIDEINRNNPTPSIGRLEATNPCGELPLLPYESCNLASINLGRMVKDGAVDWGKLKNRIQLGIRFLDNVIDVNKFPLPQIKKVTFSNRKIGLGVMGFADMLIKLNISYNSKTAIDFSEKLMKFIQKESIDASCKLAAERGVFPNFKKSIYARKNLRLRNATVNTIAPTGSISIIAGCSSGIEPLFAISFVRNILSDRKLFETNVLFEDLAKREGFYNKNLMSEIAQKGSLRDIKGIAPYVKDIFLTAFDIGPLQHLKIQVAFQKYSDNSVSKTVNLTSKASEEDVRNIYIMAYKLKCKGITVYRYGSKRAQVLAFGQKAKEGVVQASSAVKVDSEYSGGCISTMCPF